MRTWKPSSQKMAEQYGMDVEMVKKYLSKEQVHDQILSQKAVAVVVDSATAEKPAKKTAKKAETAEGEEKKPAKKTTKKAETAESEEKPPRRLPLRRLPRRKQRKPNRRPKLFRGDHGTFYRFDTFSHGTRGIMERYGLSGTI